MKKFILLSIVFLFFSCDKEESTATTAIEGKIVWSKTFGGSLEEKTNAVVSTPDGGVIIVGNSKSTDGDVSNLHGLEEIWVTKLDKDGVVVWNKSIGGSENDYGMSIIRTNDNNYVIAGYSGSSDFDVPRNIGMHDFYITKINESGTIIWSKSYGFLSHDHAHKIIQTQDGGYFVAGFADYSGLIGQTGNGEGHVMGKNQNSTLHGVGEFFGIKLDALGEFMWFRYYGGTQNDRINDVANADDGGLILVGSSESNDFDVVGSHGSYDYWVIKIDNMGHLHWKKTYGGSDIDQAFGVVNTGNNSYLIVGQSNSSNGDIKKPLGNSDAWIIHINDHGHLIWEKSFGGSQFDTALSIKKVDNNKFMVVGHSRSNDYQIENRGQNDVFLFTINTQANSSVLWQKTFGGSNIDLGSDFTQTSDGGIVIVGDTQSNNGDFVLNRGFNDRFAIKIK